MGIEAALIGGGLGLIGSSMQADAASESAASQAAAAKAAAEAAAFRPVGLTTRFGRSGYTYDANGNLVGAGYQVAPDLAAMREGLIGLAGGSLGQAQNAAILQPWFNQQAQQTAELGTKYLSTTPEQAAQSWMSQQQGLLAPGREQALAKVRNNLQQTGRAGLAFGATEAGNRAATNPEMAAYYNAMAQQDADLASKADLYGQARNTYGLGLLGSGVNLLEQGYGLQQAALKPWQSYLGAANTVEGMGAGAMDASSALGAKTSTAGATQAQYLNRTAQPQYSQLGTGLMGLAQNQQFTNALSGLFNSSPTMSQTASTYGTNLGSQQTSMLNAQDAWFK
jgi:hypothetical protein